MTDADKSLRKLTGYRLQRANSAAMVRFKSVFEEFGLRRTTFSCLSLIVETPGLRQGQLGEVLAIERPNLVKIVDDLTKAGLIARERSQTDRRAYALHPTDKGKALYDQARAKVKHLDTVMTQGLSDQEVEQLQTALDLVERNTAALHNRKNQP